MRTLIAAAFFISTVTFASAGDLSFSSDASSPVYRAIAEQFVKPALRDSGVSGVADPEFGWARADVDGNGYDELFVQLLGPSYCSAGDCPVIGYRKAPEGYWPAILTTMATHARFDGNELVTSSNGIATRWKWDPTAEMMLSE